MMSGDDLFLLIFIEDGLGEVFEVPLSEVLSLRVLCVEWNPESRQCGDTFLYDASWSERTTDTDR